MAAALREDDTIVRQTSTKSHQLRAALVTFLLVERCYFLWKECARGASAASQLAAAVIRRHPDGCDDEA